MTQDVVYLMHHIPRTGGSTIRNHLLEHLTLNESFVHLGSYGRKWNARTGTPAEWTKPAVWGVIGGAIAAIVISFVWGGWVTGGTATQMEAAGAETAIVQAFTPLCVAKADKEPEQLARLKEESTWKHDDFVVEAGWVANVKEKYRAEVARACAKAALEAMEVEATE